MKKIEKRVSELEAKSGEEQEPIRITRIIVKPGRDGPIKVGRWLPESGQIRAER